jgi:hypothetical protein
MDIDNLSDQAQRAMECLAAEVARIEADMGDISAARKGAYLSHMASMDTFSTLDDQSLVRSFGRMVTGAAVALLAASLVIDT